MIAKQHEHRDKDWSEDRPLCGTGCHEDVDERAEDDESHPERDSGEIDPAQEVRAGDRQHGAELCPVEQRLELSAEETEQNVAAHCGHLARHCLVDINHVFEFSAHISVGQTAHEEEYEQDRDQSFQEIGTDQSSVLVGKRAGHKQYDDDQDIENRGNSGGAERFLFLRADFLHLLGGIARVCTKSRLDDLDGHKTDHDRTQKHGRHEEEPVAGDVHLEGAVRHESCDRLIGQALDQRVGAGDHEVGGCTGLCACVADDHADDRMFADAQVEKSGQRRNNDHRRIGGDVAERSDKRDCERNERDRYVFHAAVEQRYQHSGFLTDADCQCHGNHEAERRKTGKVCHHVVQEPVQTFRGEQVCRHDGFPCGRIRHGDAREAEDCSNNGDDHEQAAEEDGRRRKLVAHGLDAGEHAVHPGFFGCGFLFHTIHSLSLNLEKGLLYEYTYINRPLCPAFTII